MEQLANITKRQAEDDKISKLLDSLKLYKQLSVALCAAPRRRARRAREGGEAGKEARRGKRRGGQGTEARRGRRPGCRASLYPCAQSALLATGAAPFSAPPLLSLSSSLLSLSSSLRSVLLSSS
eukprot:2910062-Prymnesium_polylepis.1